MSNKDAESDIRMQARRARAEANSFGHKFYCSPVPCARGHQLRYVSSRQCIECTKRWREANMERHRARYAAREAEQEQARLT